MTDIKKPQTARQDPSKMAEGIALHRFSESRLPEDERILYDPYAIHFIDPNILGWAASHTAEAKALADEWEQKMPGWSNTIRARVRYFDDFVKDDAGHGLEQLIIPGAGYDTRACRLPELKTVKIFELDRPETQTVKTGIIKKIFGSLPGNVEYIPADLETESLEQCLISAGYSRAKKTLYVLEGFVMYMPRETVGELLSFIREKSGSGSSVIFDYIPACMAEGTCNREDAKNIRDFTIAVGEPLRSGFKEGEAIPFLEGLGFTGVHVVTGEDFRRLYFQGKNEGRPVSDLMSVMSAEV